MWGHYCPLKPSCFLLQNPPKKNFKKKTFLHKSHLCVTQQSDLLPCLLLWGVLSTDGVITASWGKNTQLELDRCCKQQLFGLFFSLWPPGATMDLADQLWKVTQRWDLCCVGRGFFKQYFSIWYNEKAQGRRLFGSRLVYSIASKIKSLDVYGLVMDFKLTSFPSR